MIILLFCFLTLVTSIFVDCAIHIFISCDHDIFSPFVFLSSRVHQIFANSVVTVIIIIILFHFFSLFLSAYPF